MQTRFHILLVILLALVGCADDIDDREPRDVHFCLREVWHSSMGAHRTSRAATDFFADGTGDIVIEYADYPATVNVRCSDGTDFTLAKGGTRCATHNTFWSYTPSIIYKDKDIIRDNLTFTATATIDDGDELTGEATKDDLHANHLQFTLHHTKALLRFAFRVHEDYYRLRQVRVTAITLTPDGGDPITLSLKKPHMLTTNKQCIAYGYIAPMEADVLASQTFRISCTYDIYDKDVEPHLTRKDVTAQNHFTLDKIVFSSSAAEDHKIKPGYYYDLNVTLNPDYLYVLSEHDNKHIVIN